MQRVEHGDWADHRVERKELIKVLWASKDRIQQK